MKYSEKKIIGNELFYKSHLFYQTGKLLINLEIKMIKGDKFRAYDNIMKIFNLNSIEIAISKNWIL